VLPPVQARQQKGRPFHHLRRPRLASMTGRRPDGDGSGGERDSALRSFIRFVATLQLRWMRRLVNLLQLANTHLRVDLSRL